MLCSYADDCVACDELMSNFEHCFGLSFTEPSIHTDWVPGRGDCQPKVTVDDFSKFKGKLFET